MYNILKAICILPVLFLVFFVPGSVAAESEWDTYGAAGEYGGTGGNSQITNGYNDSGREGYSESVQLQNYNNSITDAYTDPGRAGYDESKLRGAGGLVPCNGPDCDINDVVDMANRVINFLLQLLMILGTIALVAVGFGLVISGGNSEAWTKAKNRFTNVVFGLILVLAAWLIVDTIMLGLTGKGLAGWSLFGGTTQSGVNNSSSGAQGSAANLAPSGITSSGDESGVRSQLLSMGYTVPKGSCNSSRYQDVAGGCTSVGGFTDGMMSSLDSIGRNCTSCNRTITGGSEAGHQTHDDGNSVDFRFSSNVNNFINNGGAEQAGLRCVRESDHWHCRR